MALPALSALRSRSGLRRVLVANALYNFVETAAWIAIILWAYDVGGAVLAGEIALLHVVPRTATITALEPTWLLTVDAADFLAAVTGGVDGGALAREVANAHMRRDRS